MANYYQVGDNREDGLVLCGDSTRPWGVGQTTTPTFTRDASTAATAFAITAIGITDSTTGVPHSYGFDSSAHALAFVTALSTAVTQINAIQTALVEKNILGSP